MRIMPGSLSRTSPPMSSAKPRSFAAASRSDRFASNSSCSVKLSVSGELVVCSAESVISRTFVNCSEVIGPVPPRPIRLCGERSGPHRVLNLRSMSDRRRSWHPVQAMPFDDEWYGRDASGRVVSPLRIELFEWASRPCSLRAWITQFQQSGEITAWGGLSYLRRAKESNGSYIHSVSTVEPEGPNDRDLLCPKRGSGRTSDRRQLGKGDKPKKCADRLA